MSVGYYFRHFPTIPYETFDGSGQYKVVIDIFKRVRATLAARQDSSVYYNYTLKEKESPEVLAFKYYGQPQYHWVILLMNEMRDPFWSWPLDGRSFQKYLDKKYGSIAIAKTTISHYRTKEILATTTDDNYNVGDVILRKGTNVSSDFSYSYTTSVSGVPGSLYTWLPVDVVESVSMYDKEDEANEKNRKIILLRRNLLTEFVDEFDNLITMRR